MRKFSGVFAQFSAFLGILQEKSKNDFSNTPTRTEML